MIQIIARFSVFNILQGSVATHLTYVGISINNFIASFLLNVSVEELWNKSIVSPFFLTHGVVHLVIIVLDMVVGILVFAAMFGTLYYANTSLRRLIVQRVSCWLFSWIIYVGDVQQSVKSINQSFYLVTLKQSFSCICCLCEL